MNFFMLPGNPIVKWVGYIRTHSDCQYDIIQLVKEITNMGKA